MLTATSDQESFSQASLSTDLFDVIGPEPQAALSVIVGSAGAIADGEDEATITIELFDEDGNGVAGIIPEFLASGGGNSYRACSETNVDGVAICQMTSTVAEEKTLEITEPVQVIGETIEFLFPCEDSPSPFGGGEGKSDDPYRICTPAHLNEIQGTTNALNGTFVLARNLDMAQINDFNIIGDSATPFNGTFDGRGFRIRNLKIERPEQDFVGIFGALGEGAVIENIILEAIEIRGNDFVGSLAGSNEGRISSCSAITSLVRGNGSIEGGIGGLVGFNQFGGAITDSTSDVSVEGQERNIGGLVGHNQGEISGSDVTGSVEVGGLGVGENVGGLVGFNQGPINDSSSEATVRGRNFVGGFVGSNFEGGTILDSSASGDVGYQGTRVDDGNQIGGFAGLNDGEIKGSQATGNVAGRNIVGGLIGNNREGNLENCFATGSVVAEKNTVGGLVGFNGGVTIRESFATGDVVGIGSVGGLIGSNLGIVEDSYSLGTVTGFRRVGGLIGALSHFESVGATEVNRTFATGSVIFSSSTAQVGENVGIGGLVGNSRSAIISESYATGSVEAADNDPSGGLVGVVINSEISNSNSAGLVEDGNRGGGLFGNLDSDSRISACYWDFETSENGRGVANGSQDGVTGLSTDEFASTGNFAGTWDFDEIWIIDDAPDGEQRPVLRSEE